MWSQRNRSTESSHPLALVLGRLMKFEHLSATNQPTLPERLTVSSASTASFQRPDASQFIATSCAMPRSTVTPGKDLGCVCWVGPGGASNHKTQHNKHTSSSTFPNRFPHRFKPLRFDTSPERVFVNLGRVPPPLRLAAGGEGCGVAADRRSDLVRIRHQIERCDYPAARTLFGEPLLGNAMCVEEVGRGIWMQIEPSKREPTGVRV